MAVPPLLKTFITKWRSLSYSEHSLRNDSLPDNRNIHKMTISLLFKVCTRWQSLWYNIQNTAVFLLLKTFITKWQSLWYSEHSSQNGSHSDTQIIHHKMAVTPIIRTIITKWQSLWYSEHSSQNSSHSDTQNIHHKMAVSLLPKTLTKLRCLHYSEYSYLVFLNGYPRRFSM